MRKPMAVTPRKIEANRRNAQKSTGPKTAEGRAVSKLNALKHGVLARTVLVRGDQFCESKREFKTLCAEFYAAYRPAGAVEEMLVDQIVQTNWRLRRARRAETGEIALNVDESYQHRQSVHPKITWMLWRVHGDPVWAMRHSASGGHILINWLHAVRRAVEQSGELSEETIQIPFGGQPNELSDELKKIRDKFPLPEQGEPDLAIRQAEVKARLISAINKELSLLEWRWKQCEELEESMENSRQAAAALPPAERMDKILRYEAALQRELYRAMNQLERMQRQRQGEVLPAPLSVEISGKP